MCNFRKEPYWARTQAIIEFLSDAIFQIYESTMAEKNVVNSAVKLIRRRYGWVASPAKTREVWSMGGSIK